MPNHLPNDSSKKKNGFGDLMQSMNEFFHEKPMRGMLQSIDEFFTSAANPFQSFPVNLKEHDHHYLIVAELPGVKKEQINLEVFPNFVTITITDMLHYTEENEKHQVIKSKQTMNRSSRTIPFPSVVNEKDVKASYKDGLLQIKVEKQSGKRISID
ncbi:Hsp20/alpha crystallin family protein [Rossellomorea aquimaris]|uniref:Hsp20/alpha crystallin family protein n=1 Tax=Rossellomorea aquimaris TaxID=189382 RepID=UPI001CD721CB|nr:Hsp20/alpha crystallin family protein [Rossellomorea aquimaris]MCA1054595.1 Hsp20/alpha crystallin family protein [Rossellomorea aquimaris]